MGRRTLSRFIQVPNVQDLDLDQQDPGKQATSLKADAYRIAKLVGRNILLSLRDDNQKAIAQQVLSFGICADKVLKTAESSGLTLTVPAQLIEKFMAAVLKRSDAPLQIDKPQLP